MDGRHTLPDTHATNVRTQMSLHELAYNMKRMISLIGIASLIEAMRAF